MQRQHFLRLLLLAAALTTAFTIITLSINPAHDIIVVPTLAVLPSEPASSPPQIDERQAEVAILSTVLPLETDEPIPTSTNIPTDTPTRISTNRSEVVDLPANTAPPEITASEVVDLPANTAPPEITASEVVDLPANTAPPEITASEVVPPQTDVPQQPPTAQTFPTVDIRPTAQDQVQSNPVLPVLPAETPLDESQLTETERVLLQQVQEQDRIGVIVGLAVPFQYAGSTTAQELQAQEARVQQARVNLVQSLAAYDVEVSSDSTNWSIPFIALRVDERGLRALIASSDVTTIDENGRNTASLSSSAPVIHAPQAWAMGYRGNGQTVAIVDSGVERTHAFLGGRVVSEACYSGGGYYTSDSLCPNGQLSQIGTGSASPSLCLALGGGEGCSHGTHVAGIAAGYQSSGFSGVAPNANIIGIQVFSLDYYDISAWDSDIISGLSRVYALRGSYPIAAVNLSLGDSSRGSSSHCDSRSYGMTSIFQQLRGAGIAPVVATGNNGYSNFISFPACISYAVSVGASTDNDVSASFSNDAVNIQELFAPGVSITSSVAPSGFDTWDGTSMAAPHVTGAFAAYRQFSPNASVDAIVNTFRQTGQPISVSGGTVPRLNLQAAILGTPPTPGNDLRNNAAPIVTLPYNAVQSDIPGATITGGDPAFCTGISSTVWYRYTASSTQTLTLSTVSSNYDTVLAVFNATTLASLGCDDQSGGNNTSLLSLNVTQGSTYLIGIGSWVYPAPASSTLVLNITGSITPMPVPPRPSGIGIYYNGSWYLRDAIGAGSPTWMPQYGGFGVPVVGDWNGNGTATLGIYNPANGQWFLRNSNDPGAPDYPVFIYGGFGLPIVGDWNGDGVDTIGLYNPSGGQWYLRDFVTSGGTSYPPFTYAGFGVPVIGDWDGNGTDTIGVYNPANGMWYLRNSNSSGSASYVFQYGGFGTPVVGDWDGDGIDTIGIYNPADGQWFLRNSNASGAPSYAPFVYGGFGVPVVGTWSIAGAFGIDGAMEAFSGDWEAIMEEEISRNATPTLTPTATETAAASPTATEPATATPSATPTGTETLLPTLAPTETASETPSSSETPNPTVTLEPTIPPVLPTETMPPPSDTPAPTATLEPTATPVPPTGTSVPPSSTPVPTETPSLAVTEEASASG
jgi:subtilisin